MAGCWLFFLPPPARQLPEPPVVSPRVFKPPGRFLPSSFQVEDDSDDLIVFVPGLAALSFFLSSAPSALTGLCKVPFFSSSAGLAAFMTRAGAFIISRMANASASALARRTRICSNSSSRTLAAAALSAFSFLATSAFSWASSALAVEAVSTTFSASALAAAFSASSRDLRSISAFISAS